MRRQAPNHALLSLTMFKLLCAAVTAAEEHKLVRECALTLSALAGLPLDWRCALHSACPQGEVVW